MPNLITAAKIKKWLPSRTLSAHKGSCGRIYVCAGSKGMVGAGILTCLGAVQVGAGMVRLGVVKSQQNIAARRVPLEVTTDALPEKDGCLDYEKINQIQKYLHRFFPDVIALGPGLGHSSSSQKVVLALLRHIKNAVVLDADGLNAMAASRGKINFSQTPVVITPHPGELARLLGCSVKNIQLNRINSAKEGAMRFRCVCLLKGSSTLVTDGKIVWQNTTGNPAMASAGMGDLLTGIISALWGQMPEKNLANGFKAAILGAYLHGKAGDRAAKKIGGLSVSASQVAEFVPSAIKNLRGGFL